MNFGEDLHLAADSGDLETLLSILHTHPEPGFIDTPYRRHFTLNRSFNPDSTPTMYAIRSGHLHIIRELILAHADLSKLDFENWNCMTYASYAGHVDMCKLLLDAGVSSQIRDSIFRQLPIDFACHQEFPDIVSLLTQPGVTPPTITPRSDAELLKSAKKKPVLAPWGRGYSVFCHRYSPRSQSDLDSLQRSSLAHPSECPNINVDAYDLLRPMLTGELAAGPAVFPPHRGRPVRLWLSRNYADFRAMIAENRTSDGRSKYLRASALGARTFLVVFDRAE